MEKYHFLAPGDVLPDFALPLALLVLLDVGDGDGALVLLVVAHHKDLVLVDQAPALDQAARRPTVHQLAGFRNT